MATWRLPPPPPRLRTAWRPSTAFLHHDPWNSREGIRRGQFCFLNERVSLGRPVDWAAPEQSLLWRFTLHYFDYLHLLTAEEQVALCREWIAANSVGEGIGWHPYPTARRLVNWCRAELTAPDLLESLYRQAAYLYRNVETHVYGNHLLENARALVLAGCYLRGQGEADRWRQRGMAIYRDEIDEQVLSDGVHFERSPMYHALVLEGVLDVLNVLPEDHPDWAEMRESAQIMSDALESVTHPDGTIALFNDSTYEIAPSPDRLLRYARDVLGYTPSSRSAFPEAGYYLYRGDDLWMMIDGGPAGPEYLMAHAHADLFSYELSLFERRFIVDSGVYEYSAGPMRQYVRGTAAHNTVQIDGLDQIECWDRFRVARRAAPRDVEWTETEEGAIFEGALDGYQGLIGDDITHHRRVEIDRGARSVRVCDSITGDGEHRVESRIHLHPDIEVHREENVFSLDRGGKKCQIEIERGHARREAGWYCPRFGVRHRICTLVIGGNTLLPVEYSYQIRY